MVKPVSKVLVDNGSVVNVMSLRMLRALGRGIGDLIETEVFVSAFTGEISKNLGVLLSNTINTVFILAFSLSTSYFALSLCRIGAFDFLFCFMLLKVVQCSLHLFEVSLDA